MVHRVPAPCCVERPTALNVSFALAAILGPCFPFLDFRADMLDKSKPGFLQMSSVFEKIHSFDAPKTHWDFRRGASRPSRDPKNYL